MASALELVGQRFGMLVVVARAENSSTGQAFWACRCDCGQDTIRGRLGRSDRAISCGCVRRNPLRDRRKSLAFEMNASRPDAAGRLIPLTRGKVAVVDTADFDSVLRRIWHAWPAPDGRWYALRAVRVAGKCAQIAMHRELLCAPSDRLVDHKNGDGLDNRRLNLRLATHEHNSQNIVSSRNRKRGGFKGVTWHKQAGRWQAAIGQHGKIFYLGLFGCPEDAAKAYDVAALKRFGEFANLNFPEHA